MVNRCSICHHPKRLEIDRALVSGQNVAKTAKYFGVEYHSLYSHSRGHVTRQLSQAWHKKEIEENFDLLNTIDNILSKTQVIFERNFKEKKDLVALKALDSQRNTIQLLSNISFSLHQAKLTELEILKEKRGEGDDHFKEQLQKGLQALNTAELKLFLQLLDKVITGNKEPVIQPKKMTEKTDTSYFSSKEEKEGEQDQELMEEKETKTESEPEEVYQSELSVRPIPPEPLTYTRIKRKRK